MYRHPERIVIDLEIYLPSVLCDAIVEYLRLTDVEKMRNWLAITSEEQPKQIVGPSCHTFFCYLYHENVAFRKEFFPFISVLYVLEEFVAFANREPCLIVNHWFSDLPDEVTVHVQEYLASVLGADAFDVS